MRRERPGTAALPPQQLSPHTSPGHGWLVDARAVLPVDKGEGRGHILGGDAVQARVQRYLQLTRGRRLRTCAAAVTCGTAAGISAVYGL